MASTSTTSAKIPTELKPLFEQSVQRMLALQGYFWGPGIKYANPSQWKPPAGGGSGGNVGELTRDTPGLNVTKLPVTPQRQFDIRRALMRTPVGTTAYPAYKIAPIAVAQQAPNMTVTTQAPATENDDVEEKPLRERSEYQDIIKTLYGYDPENLPLPLQWHPREIADIGQNTAAQEAYGTMLGIGNLTEYERMGFDPAREAALLSSTAVSGETLRDNPVINAQWEAFKANALPEIQNQMALAGLGRSSSAANAIAKAWAGILPQLYENQLGREERRIERSIQGKRDYADFLVNALGRREFERQQAKADRIFDFGKWYQDYLQSKKDAEYNEWARQAGMAENALFQPFGGFVPSTIGSKTRSK